MPQAGHKNKRVKTDDEGPNPVDQHVGQRLRLRRTLMGLSQERLAEAVGLTFQQVQKYERGANRVSASRLHEFSEVLNVPVSYFFAELPRLTREGFAEPDAEAIEGLEGKHEAIRKRETLELIRAYYQITDLKLRKRMLDLIKSLGTQGTATKQD